MARAGPGDPIERLGEGARRILGREITAAETQRFRQYIDLLIKWQKSQRLIGSTNPIWIVERVLLDSLLFLMVLRQEGAPAGEMLDLGAGAGVPGLPIRIVSDGLVLTLLEARARRASFLSTAIRELGLGSTRVVNARAERVVGEMAGRFSTVVARCAGSLPAVLDLARAFLGPGGLVAVSGGPDADSEAIEPGAGAVEAGAVSLGSFSGSAEWWRTVPGVAPGTTRRFAVWRKS